MITKHFIVLMLRIMAISLLFSGCITNPLDPTIDRTTAAFDDAIRNIEQQSSSWQTVLKELEGNLTETAQSTLRTEVHNTLIRAEAAASSQVMCIIDFLGDRVLEDLRQLREQIRAVIKGEKIHLQRTPKICQVVPDAVDMSLEPNRRNVITFDGYNFDSNSNMSVTLNELLSGGINKIDVSQHLAKQTHYHMTINLGDNGVRLSPNSQSIVLTFDGGDSTIQVIQPQIPKCLSREEIINIGTRTYMPPWDPSTGDREFFGKVDIAVKVNVSWESSRLIGRIYMKAEQYDDDHTRAEGTDEFDLDYSTPPGWRFDHISSLTEDEFNYRDRTWEDDMFDRGNGLVRRYIFVGDTPTDEAGTKTQVTVDFNPVRVQIVQTENCLP